MNGQSKSVPVVLTFAGSDPSGGAGIQADIKTMHAHGVFGASVITAVTAQNTVAVLASYELPAAVVATQLDAVLDDLDISAAKTGMLASPEIIGTVTGKLSARGPRALVVDPVMISKSGYKLLNDNAIDALKRELLPLALIVTPNLHEAAALTGSGPIETIRQMSNTAEKIRAMGPEAVLIKGGHLPAEQEAVDLFYDGSKTMEFRSERLDQKHTHGTGCTYSAAIAANLARGLPLLDAVGHAKNYITEAIRQAPGIGKGVGPLNHFVEVPGSE